MKITLVIIDGSSISSTSMSFEYVVRDKILNNFCYTYNRCSTLAFKIFAKNCRSYKYTDAYAVTDAQL